ncbi:MAG: hypothetical protein ACREXU_17590 [Gammaproteobacteria bacterium]
MTHNANRDPQRIVCLTEETTETLYLLREEARIVSIDCFPELTTAASAKDRIIGDPQEVVRRAPDIIIGSWYGKRFRPERVKARGGWDAIRTAHVYEIKSADILQPGPAVLTDGLAQICRIIGRWSEETTR